MRAPGAGTASLASLALLWLLGLPWTWSAAAAFGVYVGGGGWRFLRIVCKTARRDLFGLSVLIRVRLELRRHQRAGHTIPCIFQAVVRRQPERLALVDAGSGACWTFGQLDTYSNAVANLFHQLGFAPGDVVAIFLEGRPEFVGLWLGLAKAGVVAALLNVNLRREPLAFCLGTSGAKALIYGGEMAAAVAEVSGQLGKSLLKFCSGDLGPEGILPDTHLLDPMLKEASTNPLAQSPGKGMDDRLFYIYTSGTTGLPKAAIVVHSRYYRIAAFGHHSYSMRAADVLYDCLPLYHSAGNIMGVGQCLIYGLTVVLRKKFSASRFWDDCVKYNCTVRPRPFPVKPRPLPPRAGNCAPSLSLRGWWSRMRKGRQPVSLSSSSPWPEGLCALGPSNCLEAGRGVAPFCTWRKQAWDAAGMGLGAGELPKAPYGAWASRVFPAGNEAMGRAGRRAGGPGGLAEGRGGGVCCPRGSWRAWGVDLRCSRVTWLGRALGGASWRRAPS